MLLTEPIVRRDGDRESTSSVSSRVLRPTKSMLARMASIQEDKENKRQQQSRLLPPRAAKKKPLTVPKSPNLRSYRPRKSDRLMSATSKELAEIEEIKKRVAREKQRNLRYFQRTITTNSAPMTSSGLLQSTSVCGLEAIPHKQCTKPIGFNLRVDQRANAKRKAREAEDAETVHPTNDDINHKQRKQRRTTIPRRPVTEPPVRRSRRLMMRRL